MFRKLGLAASAPRSSHDHPRQPTAAARADIPNDLEAFWLPFTPNRAFKKRPRLIARSKDMHYYTPEGRADPRRHARRCGAATPAITASRSSRRSSARRRSSTSRRPSGFAHPPAFQLASRIADLAPADLDHVFFCNSGSEAVDTALKIALAYHNVRGQGLAHPPRSAASAAITASASAAFRSAASSTTANSSARCWPGVDHLPATYNREHQAFTKGEPEWGGASRRRARGDRRACTTPRPSPPSSSSRWPARPACCRRPRAISSACARSATSTASS